MTRSKLIMTLIHMPANTPILLHALTTLQWQCAILELAGDSLRTVLVVAFRKAVWWSKSHNIMVAFTLTAEAMQGVPLPLQGAHDVHGCYRLPLGVLRVDHCVPDDIIQEHPEDVASLLVDGFAEGGGWQDWSDPG